MVRFGRKTSRAERDVAQRRLAKAKYKSIRKMLPKDIRRRDVQAERRAQAMMMVPSIEEQGFAENATIVFSVGMIAASVAYFGYKVGTGIADAAKNAVSPLERMGDSFRQAMDFVKAKLEEYARYAKEMMGEWWKVPFALLALYLVSRYTHIPILPLICGTVIARIAGEKVWQLIKQQAALSPQWGPGQVVGLGAMLCTLVCTILLPSRGASYMAGELIKRVGSFDRSVSGFELIFQSALGYAERAVNALLKMLGRREVHWVSASYRMVDDFVSKVDAFDVKTRDTSVVIPMGELLEANELYIYSIGLLNTVKGGALEHRLSQAATRLERLLIPYQGGITAARNFRAEPIFLCLYGESGVGKTSLVSKLATSVMVLAGLASPGTALQSMWQKSDSEYWNGYVHQPCLIMDDCFQVLPVAGSSENEYMNIIKMMGSWACNLNMADLLSKGKIYFDTPLVIGTTNAASIQHMAGTLINCPEAVIRRIKHPYKISVNDEYATTDATGLRVLDWHKLEKTFTSRLDILEKAEGLKPEELSEAYLDAYPWEAWTLTQWDYATGMVAGPSIGVKELMLKVVEQLRTSKSHHEEGLRNMERMLKGIAIQDGTDIESSSSECESPLYKRGRNGLLYERVESADLPDEWDYRPIITADPLAGEPDLPQITPALEEDPRRDGDSKFWNMMASWVRLDSKPMYMKDPVSGDISGTVESASTVDWHTVMRKLSHDHPILGSVISLSVIAGSAYVGFKFSSVVVGGVIKLAGLIMAAWKSFVSLIFGSKAEDQRDEEPHAASTTPEEQSNAGSGEMAKNGPKSLKRARPGKVQLQDGMAPSDHIQNTIFENSYKLYIHYGTMDEVAIGQIQMLELELAVQPRHYRKGLLAFIEAGKLTEDDVLSFVRAGTGDVVKMPVKSFLYAKKGIIEGSDVEFMRYPRGSLLGKKITQHVATDKDHNNFERGRTGVRLDIASQREVRSKKVERQNTQRATHVLYVHELATGTYNNSVLYEYKIKTEKGDCGAPLMMEDARNYGGRCYLGFHVAGTANQFDSRGYANKITREMVDDARQALGITKDQLFEDMEEKGVPIEVVPPEEQSGLQNSLIRGSFRLLGKVERALPLCPKTRLKPTQLGLDEEFGANPQAPAKMAPFINEEGVKVFPMLEGLSAYTTPLEYKEIPQIDAIVDLATKPFREASQHDWRGILSKEEACGEWAGLKIKSIARSTSPGYPWCFESKDGKRDYFGCDDEFEYTSGNCEKLFERVEHIITRAKEGVRLAHIFTDFLKDETRPMEKVRNGATRIISGAPLDYVVAFRMYFGAFMAAMFKHNTESGMCPGINPFREWHKLASKLSSHGKYVFDGDFKRFDASEQPFLHWKILDFVNRWYDDGEENAQVRTILWYELVNSRHIGGDGTKQCYIYEWVKSLPSGHPFTTPVNSLYSLITITTCYVAATGDLTDMWSRVYIGTFGDDNIVNAADSVSEVFNQETVASMMGRIYGLTYTEGSKQGKLSTQGTLETCTFLKRSFRRNAMGTGGWVAPIDKDSFLYTSYFFKNARDKMGDMKRNLESSIGELSLHDRDTWDEYYPRMISAMRKYDIVPMFTTPEAWFDYMGNRYDAWW